MIENKSVLPLDGNREKGRREERSRCVWEGVPVRVFFSVRSIGRQGRKGRVSPRVFSFPSSESLEFPKGVYSVFRLYPAGWLAADSCRPAAAGERAPFVWPPEVDEGKKTLVEIRYGSASRGNCAHISGDVFVTFFCRFFFAQWVSSGINALSLYEND